jgi:hypothetical protein
MSQATDGRETVPSMDPVLANWKYRAEWTEVSMSGLMTSRFMGSFCTRFPSSSFDVLEPEEKWRAKRLILVYSQ